MTGDKKQDGQEITTSSGETIGGILLAAGKSSRFEGSNKLLAVIEEKPLVYHSAQSLLRSDVDEVTVVIGHDAEAVRTALESLDVRFKYNDGYAKGQSTSVRTGIKVAHERDWDGVVFALGDMPFINPNTIDDLLNAHRTESKTIAAAAYNGTRGNPVLFDSKHFDTLATITGDQGGRRLIEQHEETVLVETSDPGVIQDIDSESDLDRYQI